MPEPALRSAWFSVATSLMKEFTSAGERSETWGRPMSAAVDNMLSFGSDLVAIHQLLSLHGHLVDGREFDRFDELFTNDVVYDVTDMGQGIIQGLSSLRDVSAAFVEDERNPRRPPSHERDRRRPDRGHRDGAVQRLGSPA